MVELSLNSWWTLSCGAMKLKGETLNVLRIFIVSDYVNVTKIMKLKISDFWEICLISWKHNFLPSQTIKITQNLYCPTQVPLPVQFLRNDCCWEREKIIPSIWSPNYSNYEERLWRPSLLNLTHIHLEQYYPS